MSSTARDAETLDFSEAGAESQRRLVGLTLLNHPDPNRVGQISVLFPERTGGRRRVCRAEPDFRALTGSDEAPLDTKLVSRRALVISTPSPDVLAFEVEDASLSVSVGGEPLTGGRTFPIRDLVRGLVVELGAYVVLLVHFVPSGPSPACGRLQGESFALRAVKLDVQRVADTPTSVLIRGESGTGKELVARAIHELSPRRSGPFIAVNMGAIAESMGPSALFGHERGAFTGASHKSEGYFAAANGGTLFLDEIGETPRGLQASLLRALREGQIQPVGASLPRPVDVRVLTATDAPLETLTEEGEFSLALLKRIDSYTITLPPLRERRDDVARLFVLSLRQQLEELGESDKLLPSAGEPPFLPGEFMARLVEYAFPGNVAELRAIALRVAIASRHEARFRWDDGTRRLLSPKSRGDRRSDPARTADASEAAGSDLPAGRTIRRDPNALTDQEIVAAMRHVQFKPGDAAKHLGVSRAWLFARLDRCPGVRLAKHLEAPELQSSGLRNEWDVDRMAAELEVSAHGLRLRLNQLGLRNSTEDPS